MRLPGTFCDGAPARWGSVSATPPISSTHRLPSSEGVSRAGEIWWSALREAVAETLIAGVRLEVVPAALGDDAPLWGALALGAGLL